ncbi:hypothetical protein ABVT39_009324 [Epinephelus coioides]
MHAHCEYQGAKRAEDEMERRKNAIKMNPLTAYFQNTGLDSHREEDEGDNGRDLNEDESDKEHPDHIHEEDGVSEVERSQSDRLSEGEEEEEGIDAERTNENVESRTACLWELSVQEMDLDTSMLPTNTTGMLMGQWFLTVSRS